jgi:hypothetical protein
MVKKCRWGIEIFRLANWRVLKKIKFVVIVSASEAILIVKIDCHASPIKLGLLAMTKNRRWFF